MPEMDEWEQDRLRISMDLSPQTVRGIEYLEEHGEEPRPHRLMSYHDVSPRVPVYIIYYTAYPNPSTGIVQTWPDLYGYDKAIASAIDSFLPK
jgi:murein L,D-transpeptidase YcbB/YkuD